MKSTNCWFLLDNLQTGMMVHKANTEVVYLNTKALEMLRLSQNQIIGKDLNDPLWSFLDTDSVAMTPASFPVNKVIASKQSVTNLEIGIVDNSSSSINWALCSAHPQFNECGKIEYIIVELIDITKQKEEIPFKDIVGRAGDSIIVTDAEYFPHKDPKILYTNEYFTTLTEYTKDDIKGKSPAILQGPETSNETIKSINNALAKNRAITCEILNYTKSKKSYWVELCIFPLMNKMGELKYFASIARDISTTVQKREQLTVLALCDPLTGLLNRRGFDTRVKTLHPDSKTSHQIVAIIDIDHFKHINDKYGHCTGDAILKAFSGSTKHAFRETDIVARWGGEEFIVLFNDIDIDYAYETLERFRKLTAKRKYSTPCNKSINFTISVGIAKRTNFLSLDDAIAEADGALYSAKQTTRNCVHVA